MISRLTLIALLIAATSCQKPPTKVETLAEVPVESATRWSKLTELFVEYPALAAGQASRFAVHLTRLDNFRAVTKGSVEVRLSRPNAASEVFKSEAPSRPGIFGVTVQPGSTGDARLTIHFEGEGIQDVHDLGVVHITPNRASQASEAGAADPNEITFLKEQQWTLDFATAVVEESALRASLRIPAEVTPRSGGEAEVDAPFDGRIVFDKILPIGSRIEAGQILANVVLPAPSPSDPTALDLARAEATAQLQFASRDRERAERLVASGAAPARRLDEARALEAGAQARLTAAQARLAQLEASRTASSSTGAKLFAIRAPISGMLNAVKTTPGANVRAGEALFQIVDLDTVYVSAIVPESEFPTMRNLSGAELEIPGIEIPRPLTHLVMIGRVVDSASRTFPVIYSFDNRDRRVAINQTVYVRILYKRSERKPIVPESALVDNNGSPIVFVQQSGESFLRIPVQTGQREGGMVQILEGVKAGDRLVTKGAHLVRLASMSSQAPSHGHVH